VADTGFVAAAALPLPIFDRGQVVAATALSAGLALVPLALAGSHPGAELEAPMAVVILFGLLSATALNMVVVPIAYSRFSPLRRSYDP
jgi:multidrug efflux pump subunit AcrB